MFCKNLYTHANKKKATNFVENKYRRQHVMITNIYIVSHILYDCHHYECILCAFCACLKEAWGCTPLVECIVIFQPASVRIQEMWQLGREYNHVPTGLEYTKGGQSGMDWDPQGQSRVV